MTQPRTIAGWVLGVLLLAVTVGNATAAGIAEHSGTAAPRDAVVLRGTASAGPVPVAWRGPDGSTAVATVPVPAGTRAGEPRRVWVAPGGSVVPRPPTGAAPWIAGLLVLGCGAITAGATVTARRRRRDRDLAREWARVAPQWTNTVRREGI